MRAWRAHRYGAPLEVLQLDEIAAPSPGAGELQIRVTSATLNFNDIDGIRGRYRTVPTPVPYVPGMEVLGVVEACGAGTEAWLGKRVVAIPSGAYGGYAEVVTAPAAMAFAMPASIPEPDAAAIFMPFHLAWLALHERARLVRGETILVHAAAGGVGSAALQLAVAAGARAIATAGSADKLALCRELGADVAIDYRATDFVDAVNEATGGRGVDVAFDTVGGEITRQTFRCMAFNGRHVIAGFASGIQSEDEGIVPRPLLFGNFSLLGVCHAYVDDPAALRAAIGFNFPSHASGVALHEKLLAMIEQGAVRPIIGRHVDFSELPTALDAMERRATIGRTVVRVDRRSIELEED